MSAYWCFQLEFRIIGFLPNFFDFYIHILDSAPQILVVFNDINIFIYLLYPMCMCISLRIILPLSILEILKDFYSLFALGYKPLGMYSQVIMF